MVRDRQLLIRLEEKVREELKARVESYDPKANVGTVLYEIVARIADGSLPLSVALGEDSAIPEQSVIDSILARLDAIESKLEDSEPIAVSDKDAEPVIEAEVVEPEQVPEPPVEPEPKPKKVEVWIPEPGKGRDLGQYMKDQLEGREPREVGAKPTEGKKTRQKREKPEPPDNEGFKHEVMAEMCGKTAGTVRTNGSDGKAQIVNGLSYRYCSDDLWHPFGDIPEA